MEMRVWHMIFEERHTDDDILLLIQALYSIDINVQVVSFRNRGKDIAK